MKFIFATPVYPPEIGGPAVYSQKLAEGLIKKGHAVKIVSYGGLRKYPQPLKFLLYFFRLFKNAREADLIYSLNALSCGLPACLTSKILRKKFFMRLGGDFLWERAVEAGRTRRPLREYYQDKKTFQEKCWILLIKMVLADVDTIIFSSVFQRDIYLKNFGLSREKTAIIQNPFPDINLPSYEMSDTEYQILYAGRLIKLKNIDFLIRAFKLVSAKTDKNLSLKIIGEGPERRNLELEIRNLKLENKIIFQSPVSQTELFKEIKSSYLSVLPSLSEISPNFALECLKLKKPILLTKETGYFELFKNDLIFIDPKNEVDLAEKISYLLNADNYSGYIEKIKKISTQRSWDDVVKEHEESFIHRCH